MTQPGRAAIEIIGDASRLGPQLERDAQRAIDDVDLNTDNISKQVGDGFRRAADEGRDALDVLGDDAQRVFRDIGDDADDNFKRVGRSAREAGGEIGDFSRSARRVLGGVGETVVSLGSALIGLGASAPTPAGIVALGASFVGLVAAIPVVIGLAAALADLVGIITVAPAAIGGLAASIIVITVAFQGFGDAINAVIKGDPEHITKALEGLAPAARKVVLEFKEILPLFRRIGDLIQQRFFEPLVGQLERFGTRTLPQLRGGLGELAEALGRVVGNFGDIANEAETVGILQRLLATTSTIVDRLGAAFVTLGRSLLGALDAGGPLLERVADGIGNAVEQLARFIDASVASGDFQAFFEDAVATIGELVDLSKALGDLLVTLFAGTDEGGRDFLQTLTDLTQRLTEFFKSAEGQEALQDFEEIMGAVGTILGFVINATRDFIDIFTELDDAVEATITFFEDLGTGISDVWTATVDTVSAAVESVVAFFQALPGRVLAFVQAIPGAVAAFFQSMGDQVLNIVAFAIAAVIVYFTDLPGQLFGALSALGELITSAFTAARDFIINALTTARDFLIGAVQAIINFSATLPARVVGFFIQLRDGVTARVNSLVEFVKGLPGRILSALGNVGTMLLESGKKIIQGLIDGISSKIGALREKVVSAVQTIRDHLPFSPAKTGPLSGQGSPQIAGAVIAEMIAAGLDSGQSLITQAAGRAAAAASPFGAVGQAGVSPLTTPTAGAGAATSVLSPTQQTASEQPIIVVMIDGRELSAEVQTQVEATVQTEVRRLLAGTRGV